MRQSAFEVIGVAGTQHLDPLCDGDFDLALSDDAAFLAGVREHLRPGVGAGWVDLVQDGHRTMAQAGANKEDRDIAAAEVGKPLALVEVVRNGAIIAGEEISERQGRYVEYFLENRQTD